MQHHIEQINELAQTHDHGAASIAKFACLTIRTQFETIPVQVADVINHGSASRFVWGHKREAFSYLEGGTLQTAALAARDDAELMGAFLCVPGLGLAKAGFCAQMFANRVGCLDYLNEKMYGVKTATLRKNTKEKTRQRYINEYVDLCSGIGDSATLWTNWCDAVGERKAWPNGDAVSQTHVNLISALIRNG